MQVAGAGSRIAVRRRSGPVSYATFRQRVRRFRQTDLLTEIAKISAQIENDSAGQVAHPQLPNVVTSFGLAGVARTALVSANDYRSATPCPADVVDLCAFYANVDEPSLRRGATGVPRLRAVLNHAAYEQFGYQRSPMEDVGRTLALLSDHATASPAAPRPLDWERGLGLPIDQFMRLGFAMMVALVHNEGTIDRTTLAAEHVAPIFTPLTPAEALASIDRWFAATPSQLSDLGRRAEVPGAEKWSLNPLVKAPLVAHPRGCDIGPCPRLVLDRITPTGLYFIGLELFGPAFPDAVGAMFEAYVGTQLRLLTATVEPEIAYGPNGEKTVDYFVITPEVIVLVEVKSSRPVQATRLGNPVGDEDTAKKVGHALEQIDRTAQLLREGHPALADIPQDRPLRGLVITLEPFHLVNSPFWDGVLARPSIPTTVSHAHELEAAVGALEDHTAPGTRLLDALTPNGGRPR